MLKDIYDNIENPLNEETVKKLLEIYFETYSSKSTQKDFYTRLVKSNIDGKVIRILSKNNEKFYIERFNSWKNHIVNMTREQGISLRNYGKINDDFIVLREFLKKVPDVKTKKEADDIMDSNYSDSKLKIAMEKHRWDKDGRDSSWQHVMSEKNKIGTTALPAIKNRLYINSDSNITIDICDLFIKECEKLNIPYYFKYDIVGNRCDTIVIYSDNKHLQDYIDILQKIKMKNSNISLGLKQPPLLVGKIDGWIGYGSEPSPDSKGKKRSYNEVRSKIIDETITGEIINWIRSNQNMKVSYNGNNISLDEYLAMVLAESVVERFNSNLRPYEGKILNKEKLSKGIFEEIKLKPYINSDNFKHRIISFFKPKLISRLESSINSKEIISSSQISENVVIDVKAKDFKTILAKMSENIMRVDKDFINTVKEKISINAEKENICKYKFCYDNKVIQEMKKYDENNSPAKSNDNRQNQNNINTHINKTTSTIQMTKSNLDDNTKEILKMVEKLKEFGATNEEINNIVFMEFNIDLNLTENFTIKKEEDKTFN